MKRIIGIFFVSLLFLTGTAFAETKTLTINGHFDGANCAFFNKTCPANPNDAHNALEPDFVITQPNGKYYYIVNMDRETKLKYLGEDIRITGKVNSGDSLYASTLDVKKDGTYKTVWSYDKILKDREMMNRR